VYLNWLDRWDEQRAKRGEDGKAIESFALGAELAFPGERIDNIREFCARAEQASADPTFFEEHERADHDFDVSDGWIRFPSGIVTDIPENNIVWAKITRSGSLDKALVIFHHWNARSRNAQIAGFLSRRGITVVEIAMPYHLERSRPGSLHADYMLSANLGRTIQAVKQAVCDGRELIRWLKGEGYREISVVGMSLGSWVARSIRSSLEQEIELAFLRQAWSPLNLQNYVLRLARPELDLQVVLAKRDKVVLPELSHSLLLGLENAGSRPQTLRLNCGHYSLAKLPYILHAGLSLKRFLS
jgi:hypothetical protein